MKRVRAFQSRSNCYLEVLVVKDRGKREHSKKKTSRSKGENQQQPQPIYGVHAGYLNMGHTQRWEANALTTAPPLLSQDRLGYSVKLVLIGRREETSIELAIECQSNPKDSTIQYRLRTGILMSTSFL